MYVVHRLPRRGTHRESRRSQAFRRAESWKSSPQVSQMPDFAHKSRRFSLELIFFLPQNTSDDFTFLNGSTFQCKFHVKVFLAIKVHRAVCFERSSTATPFCLHFECSIMANGGATGRCSILSEFREDFNHSV